VLFDLLLPRRCVGCDRLGELVCADCRAGLPLLAGPACARCGAPTAWPVARCLECSGRRLAFASARAAVAYHATARALVTAWKQRGLRKLAAEAADVIAKTIPCPAADVIAFIPADGDRSVKRGHHPAERLARELGVRWSLPVASLLTRARTVQPQRGLSLAERRRNVRGAFEATARSRGCVALVDDVYTTGSTASAAASALRRAGARRIEVVTFARTVRTIESGVRT
jgi:predicted amidophosphoribosyltransferase